MRATAASFCSRSTRRTTSATGTGAEAAGSSGARLVVGEQVLDQLLQRQRVLAHDAHDVLLLRRQPAADVVAQELRAFAHRGQRRLELVRDVAQETRLLLLELVQARAQPLEALPQVADVLRAVHLDRVREVGGAHLPDRRVELADRTRDQHREHDGERAARCATVASASVQPLLAALLRRLLQPLDRALVSSVVALSIPASASTSWHSRRRAR